MAPPGTKVAIGINVRGLLNSPTAKSFESQQQELAAKLAASHLLAGFDPLKDLDQVLLLSTGESAKPPMLVFLRGRFDAEQMAQGAKKYHDIPLIGESKDGVLAIVDSETAIAGETALVQAAIDRLGSGAHLDTELAARMEAARLRYDIWGIGDCPDGLAAPGEGAEALGAIDRFQFGAALRQGLEATAEIHVRSFEDTVKMTAAIGLLEAALKTQAKDSEIKFDLYSENGTTQIALSMSEEELRKAVEAHRSAVVAAVSGSSGGEGVKADAPDAALAPIEEPPALPALDVLTPADFVAPVAPVAAVAAAPAKDETQPQVIKAPNGDTLVLRLPGGKQRP